MNSLPAYFPAPVQPPADHRILFADYGSLGAVDIYAGESGVETVIQKQHGYYGQQLCAQHPSIPLLPPNTIDDVLTDVCLEQVNKRREEADECQKQIKFGRKNVKTSYKDTNYGEKKKFVKNLYNQVEETASDDEETLQHIQHSCPLWFKNIVKKTWAGLLEPPEIPAVNSAYTGGGVSYQTLEQSNTDIRGVLMCPQGPGMETLALHSLHSRDGVLMDKVPPQHRQLGGHIYEVNSQMMHDICYCVVRTSDKCALFYTQTDEDTGALKCEEIVSKEWKSGPTSVYISPYIPGECVVADKLGQVALWSAAGLTELLSSQVPRFACWESWYQCHYGAHPRQIVLTDRTGMSLLDARVPDRKTGDLFVLPNRLLRNKERVMLSCTHPTNPFYHFVAADFTLCLVDQRYPVHPVLHWNHLIESPPQYMHVQTSVLPDTADDILLLSSQRSCETCCFQVKVTEGQQPQATCVPWRVSRTDDFFCFPAVRSNIVNTSLVQDRLCRPLAGVCAIPHHNQSGFTVVQMNSTGDVFHQAYHPTEDRHADKTCCLGPGAEHVKLTSYQTKLCADWLQQVQNQIDHVIEQKQPVVSQKLDASHTFDAIVCQNEAYAHVLCSLCMPATAQALPLDPTEGAQVCHTCGYSLEFTQQLKQGITQDRVTLPRFAGETESLPEHVMEWNPTGFPDATGKVVLKLWQEEKDLSQELAQREKEVDEFLKKEAERKKLEKSLHKDTGCETVDTSESDLSDSERPEFESQSENSGTERGSDTQSPSKRSHRPVSGSPSATRSRHSSVSSQGSEKSFRSTSSVASQPGFLATPTRVSKLKQSPHKLSATAGGSGQITPGQTSPDQLSLHKEFSFLTQTDPINIPNPITAKRDIFKTPTSTSAAKRRKKSSVMGF